MNQVSNLGHAEAQKAIQVIQAELTARGKAAVLVVADTHGELIALLRMDNAPLSSITVATNKAWTAARLRRPTRDVGTKLRNKGTDIAFYGDPRAVGWAGGLPVMVDGVVVGAVGVSGLPEDDDEALATVGVAVIVAALNPS